MLAGSYSFADFVRRIVVFFFKPFHIKQNTKDPHLYGFIGLRQKGRSESKREGKEIWQSKNHRDRERGEISCLLHWPENERKKHQHNKT